MDEHEPTTDDQLLEELKAALQSADGVPDDVLAAAKASFTWRTVDAELAALEFDSAVDELAGVRGGPGERQLTFRTGDVEIEIVVRGETGLRQISGQLVPPGAAVVELRTQGSEQRVDVDESGTFEFMNVPAGPASLHCRMTNGAIVATEWTVL